MSMSDDKAKFILHEIKSINRYGSIIKSIDFDLKRINEEIRSVQEPSSPQSHVGPRLEIQKEKSTIINSLLSDEMVYMEERSEFSKRKAKAEIYYEKLMLVCDESEKEFAEAFFQGVHYRKLIDKFGFENPYRKMVSLIKKS